MQSLFRRTCLFSVGHWITIALKKTPVRAYAPACLIFQTVGGLVLTGADSTHGHPETERLTLCTGTSRGTHTGTVTGHYNRSEMTDFWGKVFSSAFTGSMAGAGSDAFAVWAYALANGYGGEVELSVGAIAGLIGMPRERVEAAVEFLCSPDSKSRSPDLEGRRLEQIGPMQYRIVNYGKYNDIAKVEARRLVNREKSAARRGRVQVPVQAGDGTGTSRDMSSRSISSSGSEDLNSPDPDQTRVGARGPNGELPQSSREQREAQSFGAPALKHSWDPEWIPKKSHQARARELGLTDAEVFERLADCRLKPYPRGFETEHKHFMRELGWARAEKDKREYAKQVAATRSTEEKPGAKRGKFMP